MILSRVMATRIGGAVERCHGITHYGSYSVAAHTWGVLSLLYILWPDDFGRLAPNVMFHDVPEAWVGDIPAPTKRYSRVVKAACEEMELQILKRFQLPSDLILDDLDRAKVRACDSLELYLWSREQVLGGNQHASCIVRELNRFYLETPLPEPANTLLYEIRHGGSVEHATDGLIMELNR